MRAPNRMIPPVSVDLLVRADQKVAADHESGLPPDPTVSVIAALHGKCDHEEMIAIERRLTALAKFVVDGEAGAWTIDVDGKNYSLVADALIRAAATAPLAEATLMRDLRFGLEILDIALQIVETDGSA